MALGLFSLALFLMTTKRGYFSRKSAISVIHLFAASRASSFVLSPYNHLYPVWSVTPYATSGQLARSRDALRADSDQRAYRPCHRRDGTAGTPELFYRCYRLRAAPLLVATTGRMEQPEDGPRRRPAGPGIHETRKSILRACLAMARAETRPSRHQQDPASESVGSRCPRLG